MQGAETVTTTELLARAGIEATAPEVFPLVMGLVGGLALFLFGLEQMTVALRAVAGDRLRGLLRRLTLNRLAGVATGAAVTAVIQSSSITTVLVVGFISSGLMSLSQAVGVIMGANVGTTVTAQIIAFKVTKLAFLLIAAGFGLVFFSKRETLRHHGSGMLGLGLVFLGMTVMSEAMEPLRGYEPFLAWVVRMEHPALGVLAGAVFTGLIQSSSATTGVVIAMASQGLLTLPAGIALILGANVGTCVTALLSSIGKPREASRAAAVHVLFNVAGVVLWVGFVGELARLSTWLSPQAPALIGADRLAAEVPRQVANAHTIFNVANTLVFLPFAGLLAAVVERMVPDRPIAEEDAIRARYLDDALLVTPSLALEQTRREIVRLGERVNAMLDSVLPAMIRGGTSALGEVEQMDRVVDALYDHVISYLGRLSRETLTPAETMELFHLMSVANALESVGDVIQTDLVMRGRERVADEVSVGQATAKLIGELHAESARALGAAMRSFETRDTEGAAEVVAMKPTVQGIADRLARHQVQRLVAEEERRLPTYAAEKDMAEDLRRVFYFAKRIAHDVLDFENGSPEEAHDG